MKLILAVLLSFVFVVTAQSKDIGIFVDGGYQCGNEKLNGLVSDRVDKAKAAFDKRADKESTKATTKEALCKALEETYKCRDGDTLTLFMMGHGTSDKFVFSLAKGDKKRITARELRKKITTAVNGTDCCVRIVMFSCHSGSFLDDFFKDAHIKTVYASTQAGQKSYADAFFGTDGFEDKGDWALEFVKKWGSLDPELDLESALAEANRCANDKAPAEFAKIQRPTGWRRGTFKVRAHVEYISSSESRMRVTFYDPSHLRGKSQMMIVAPGAKPGGEFKRCDWVEFEAMFGEPKKNQKRPKDCAKNSPTIVTKPTAATAPTETFLAHVEGRTGVKKLKTTLIGPYWLACKRRTIEITTGEISPNVMRCSFVKGTATITDPLKKLEKKGGVSAFNYCPEVILKITNVKRGKNQLCGKIIRPLSLRFLSAKKEICIALPKNFHHLIDTVKNGHFVRCKIKTNLIGTRLYSGSGFRIVAGSEARLTSFERDLGIGGVVDSSATFSEGLPYVPTIEVRNYGITESPEGAALDVIILDLSDNVVYSESIPIPGIAAEEAVSLTCPSWWNTQQGQYRLVASLDTNGIPEETNLINNELIFPFKVVTEDVNPGWQAQHINPDGPLEFEAIERQVFLPGIGPGIGNDADNLSFVSQVIEGDFFVSGLVFFEELRNNASIGFHVRSDHDPQSQMAAWLVDGQKFIRFRARANPGAAAFEIHQEDVSTEQGGWLALEREGDNFRALFSLDGFDWDVLAEQALPGFPEQLLVGIASASGQGDEQPPSEVPVNDLYGFPEGLEEIALFDEIEVTPISSSEMSVRWPDLIHTEFGYKIYRSEDGEEFQEIGTTEPDVTGYDDSGLTGSTTYFYDVRPIMPDGEIETGAIGTGETFGSGLEAWALANGIADPTAAPPGGGEPWLFHYFTGVMPSESLQAGDLIVTSLLEGHPVITINKAPGIFDYHLQVETYDTFTEEWELHSTIPASDPGGSYQFFLPWQTRDRSLQRVRVLPQTLAQ